MIRIAARIFERQDGDGINDLGDSRSTGGSCSPDSVRSALVAGRENTWGSYLS